MSLRRDHRLSITTPRADRRAWRAWLAVAAIASTLTPMLDGPAVAANEPVLVILKNHQFEPRLLRVRPGQAIRFDNADHALHSLLLVGHESVMVPQTTSIASSKARSQPTCPCRYRPNTSWSLISRPPGHSALTCRRASSPAPMR